LTQPPLCIHSHAQAAKVFVPMSLAVQVTGPLAGIAADRTRSKLSALGACYAVGAAAILFLAHKLSGASANGGGAASMTLGAALVFGALWGAAAGCIFCVRDIIHADLFGRSALGKIGSTAVAFGTAASGLGPVLFGVCKDMTRSYDLVMWVIGGLVACCSVGLVLVPPPTLPGSGGGRGAGADGGARGDAGEGEEGKQGGSLVKSAVGGYGSVVVPTIAEAGPIMTTPDGGDGDDEPI
jgi:hypothetical protein